MLAHITLVGRLGRDPEAKVTPSGVNVTKFSVATQEHKNEETSWWDVAAFGKSAEFCSRYLKKGSLVFVEGRISINKYTSSDGTKRSAHKIASTKIQSLNTKAEDESSQLEERSEHSFQGPNTGSIKDDQAPKMSGIPDLDSIPF